MRVLSRFQLRVSLTVELSWSASTLVFVNPGPKRLPSKLLCLGRRFLASVVNRKAESPKGRRCFVCKLVHHTHARVFFVVHGPLFPRIFVRCDLFGGLNLR